MTVNKTKITGVLRKRVLLTGIMLMISLVSFSPFYLLIIMGTHSTSDLYKGIHLLAGSKTLFNIKLVIEAGFLRYYANSLYVAATVTALSVLVSMACGYALAKYNFRSNYFPICNYHMPTRVNHIAPLIKKTKYTFLICNFLTIGVK